MSESGAYRHIGVSPIAGALGAEISGVDLARVSDETFEEIHRAFLENGVIFFRDQGLTRDEHKAFGSRFGELHVHPYLQPLKEDGHPELVVLESSAERPFVAGGWHSDVTFAAEPPLGSILRCVEAPPQGGDTMWASMYAAYDALSEVMARLLSGLEAEHDTAATFSRPGYGSGLGQGATPAPDVVANHHPVVRTHPETGRKALFVNSGFTRRVVGMKPAESNALLQFLYRHIESPEFSCRFRWRKNSIAFWDNRCTQHRVLADNLTAYRRMERVTVCGDRPR